MSIATARKTPITVRWVDVSKGHDIDPNVRSRLVPRRQKAHDFSGTKYFAADRPLEEFRTVIGLTVTSVGDCVHNSNFKSEQRTQISFVDVKRAYFNA